MFFPHPMLADHHGLLAAGGDLSTERLLLAYHFGIFPWYSEGQEILWWTPDPRCVLYPSDLKISKSMRSFLKKTRFTHTIDYRFEDVIRRCALVTRKGQEGTWITQAMIDAYILMHHQGIAHSVEVWVDDKLVGGLYGLALGRIFFGESMFSLASNASKFALTKLVESLSDYNYLLIDCQQDTPHLRSLGAKLITRKAFLNHLRENMLLEHDGPWKAS